MDNLEGSKSPRPPLPKKDKAEETAGAGGSGLGQHMAKGAAWMVMMRFGIRMIGIVSTIILARLLLPTDFGLVALATALQFALAVMSEFSFDVALIQNRNAGRKHFDTAWTLTIIRNAILAVILIAVASPMSHFFEDDRLENVIYCLALATFIEGFQNIGIVRFLKDLRYHMEFIFMVAIKVSMFAITIPCAFMLRNYWALVAGLLGGAIMRLVLSYLMERYRPRLNLSKWREIIHFSKWLLVTNVVQYATLRSANFVLGKILGSQALGFYVMAYEISTLATSQLVAPIRRALLPGYAKLAEDPKKLGEGFIDTLALILLVGVPVAAGIGLIAEPLVLVMLSDKWIESTPLLQILALYGVLNVCTANSGPVYIALGRPAINAFIYIAGLVVLLPLLIWGTNVAGAQGAAWAMTASAAVLMATNTVTVIRLLRLSPLSIFKATWRTFVSVGVMAAAVAGLQEAWPVPDVFLERLALLLSCTFLGVVVYTAVHLALWRLCGLPAGAEQHVFTTVAKATSKFFAKRSGSNVSY